MDSVSGRDVVEASKDPPEFETLVCLNFNVVLLYVHLRVSRTKKESFYLTIVEGVSR